MASSEMYKRLENAYRDLDFVPNSPNFRQLSGMSDIISSFNDARDLAKKWFERARPVLAEIDDSSIQPLALFTEEIARIVDQRVMRQNETIGSALRRAIADFRPTLPILIFAVLEALGMTGLSDEDFPKKREEALHEIDESRSDVVTQIRNSAAEMVLEPVS